MSKIYYLLYTICIMIPYELLSKYCQNKISFEEKEEVEKWLLEGDNASIFQELKSEWTYVDDQTVVTPDKNFIWNQIEKSTTKAKKHQVNLYKYLSVAAIILLLVTSGALFFQFNSKPTTNINYVDSFQQTTVSTKANEKTKVDLADGTQAWLNSNSTITFNNKYNIDNREISINGELFLDVSKSIQKFIVDAGKVKIEVLGTAFNVKTIGDNVHISLHRGKISVVNSENNKQLFIMDSAQNAVINKNSLTHTVTKAENTVSNIWKEEDLNMYNEPLSNIIEKLEAWYDLEITCEGLDETKHYSFYLQNENIHEFLDLFSAITPIEYNLADKKLSIKAN